VALQWCYSGVTHDVSIGAEGVEMVQWRYSGVTVVSRWIYSCVTVTIVFVITLLLSTGELFTVRPSMLPDSVLH
jgi:hypothetical protein